MLELKVVAVLEKSKEGGPSKGSFDIPDGEGYYFWTEYAVRSDKFLGGKVGNMKVHVREVTGFYAVERSLTIHNDPLGRPLHGRMGMPIPFHKNRVVAVSDDPQKADQLAYTKIKEELSELCEKENMGLEDRTKYAK
ncbi:MAG: hypothetical protein KKH88_02885 [Nanoarchaeota archaeon]|nr:hypothetical protein [Nanoarchaeota archaeon]